MHRKALYSFLLFTLLLASACDPASPQPPRPVEIRVGFVFSASESNSQKQAVDLALRDRESRGATPRIVPLFKETATDPESARKAFAELVAESAHVIVGPTRSSEARLAHPIAQGAGVPVLAVSNTAGGITDAGDYIFRVSMSEGEVIPEVVRSADEELELSQVSLVYDASDSFSKAVADVFRAEIERRGARILGEYTLGGDGSGARDAASRVIAEEPDAVVVSALEAEAWNFLRELRIRSSVYVIGGSAFASGKMLAVEPESAHNLIFGVPWHPLSSEPASRAFVEEYRAAYGAEPGMQAAQAYAGMTLLDAALERVDLEGKTLSEARSTIRDALRSGGTVTTELGPFSFTGKRGPKHPPAIMLARNGNLEELVNE